ncbi:MAG: type I-B CRISPR-associated protein Cas7/Cst2/DevR [Anaerolineae bacterium]|nr:type I-B CRISPR-associated protein Cas7/Cst2/DevR [Anaerolineae bacterium]
MNFLTGVYAINAPASALNNGEGEEIKATVKAIRVQQREYPYVSAQAVRFWLRETLRRYDTDWKASPVYRGKGNRQQAYTEGDPITFWDDDLFGYMRAEKGASLTRVAPFRTSTLVAAAPAEIVEDFGVMARMPGDPVLHAHEFYRATLVGAFSLDLSAVGTFTNQDRAGFRNLSDEQQAYAAEHELERLPEHETYRLPIEARLARIASLLRAFGRLEGGAKQTLHCTDVSPSFVAMAVLRGGNNPFMHLIAPTPQPSLNAQALDEALTAYQDDLYSPLFVGLRQGFMDSAYASLTERGIAVIHPRQAFEAAIHALWQHPEWLE